MKSFLLKLTNITIILSLVLSYSASVFIPKNTQAADSISKYRVIGGGDSVVDISTKKLSGGDAKTVYLYLDYYGENGLLQALDGFTKDLVRAGYAGRVKVDTSNGTDKKTFDDWVKIQSALQQNASETLAHVKNTWYIPKEFSKVAIADEKIMNTIKTLVDPKVLGGYDNWPIGLNRINKGHTCSKDHCQLTQESSIGDPTNQNETHHQSSISQAIDLDANGQIKCTLVVCDDVNDPNNGHHGNGDGRCQKNEFVQKPKAYKPVNIEFKEILPDQDTNPNILPNGGGNLAQTVGGSFQGLMSQTSKNNLFQFLAKTAEIDNPEKLFSSTSSKSSNSSDSVAGAGAVIGLNKVLEEMGLDNAIDSFPSSFQELATSLGQQILSEEVFSGKLDPDTFKGNDAHQWASSVGSNSLEKQMGLPVDSLIAGDNDTLGTVGQRYMEDLLGLKPGSLKPSSANYNNLIHQIGQGFMEKNLYLPLGSLSGSDLNKIKSLIGQDKYEEIFSQNNVAIIAGVLGLESNIVSNNLANINELKKLVGERVIDQRIRLYEQYVIKDDQDQEIARIDSRDEMLGLLNYKKPEADFTKKIITTYNQLTGEATEIPFDYDANNPEYYTYTYEKLLSNMQEENSLTRKFLKGENLTDVYRQIGAIRTAQGLSSIEDEQLAINYWLITGNIPNKTVKYDDQISSQIPAFDPQQVAQRVGLSDWYDLYKIFIKNRGGEIYPYYGMEQMAAILNPAGTDQLTAAASQDSSGTAALDRNKQFISDKLDLIAQEIDKFTDQSVKDNLKIHLQNAKTELADTDLDINTPPQKKVSSSLKNIGQAIHQNNLDDIQEAKNIYQYIYEISRGSDIDNWLPNTSTLTPLVYYGIASSDLESFFSQSLDQMNINELVNKASAGSLLYGMDMDKEFSEVNDELKAILKDNSNPVGALINGFGKENLANLATILNISLSLPNDNKLSSQDLAQILNGNFITTLKKVADKPLSDGLGVSFMGILGGNSSLVGNISDDVYSYANIADQDIASIKNLLSTAGSPNFISQTINNGVNSMLNLMDTSQIQSIPQATEIIDKFKNYLFKGVQSIGAVKDIQTLSDKIGQNIPNNLMRGEMNTALKELGAINIFKNLQGEGISLDAARIFAGVKLPDLSGINDWAKTNFGDLGDKLSSVYGQIHKLGLDTLISNNNQTVNYAYLDTIMRTNIDKNIPSGFAKAMMTGDQNTLLSSSAKWITNSIENPTDMEKAALDQLGNILSGKANASTLTSASLDVIFANKDLKTSLENAGFSQNAFASLLSSAATGTLDQNTAINISKQILLKNLSNNGATSKDLSTISAGLDLLSGNITAQKGVNAVMNVLSQDEKFTNSLTQIGLSTSTVQSLINAGLSGNFSQNQAISTLKEVTLANMKTSLAKETDPSKIKTGQQNITMVESAMDILNSGGSKESIATAMTNYISKNPDVVKSLTDAGISSGTASNLISSAINGNFNQGQAVTVLKDVVTNNMKTSLAKETDPSKIKTGQQNISIVEGAMDILNGSTTPQSIATTGLSILNKNDTFKNSLKNAGISDSSFNSLVTAAVSGNISQSQAVSVASDIMFNKIQGVQNQKIASAISGILKGGDFSASSIASTITTAFSDKIDVMFKGMKIAPGGGGQILTSLASGNYQGAIGAIVGPSLTSALTSGMDGLMKSQVGTTNAINKAMQAQAAAGQAELTSMENLDAKSFFNSKEIINSLRTAAMGAIISFATGYITQALGMDERTAQAFNQLVSTLLTGANPAVAVIQAIMPMMGMGGMLGFLGFGGGQTATIQEVYCAMDYYPWLQDDYPNLKSDQIYKGIYYWSNNYTVDQTTPGAKVADGFAQEVAKTDRIGEKLPDRPPYEFKATPSDWMKKVQQKLPTAAYLKTTQLTYDLVNLPNQFSNIEYRPGQVMIPIWANPLVKITDQQILSEQGTPEFKGLGGEIINKFMYPLDVIYGNRQIFTGNETTLINVDNTMYDLIEEGSAGGFFVNGDIYHWIHLAW